MRSKILLIFPILFSLIFLFSLIVSLPFLADLPTKNVSSAGPDPVAYLPLVVQKNNLPPITPTPSPIDPTAPWIEESDVTILSYQYDHPDCVIPTSPGDFVYPYPRINHDCVFQKPQIWRVLPTVILHNSYTAVTVIPELGGRLYRWEDKVSGRQLLYENPVLKPTAWGWRGWWLATGGIEWAFPTDEHGLNEYRPWDYTTEVLTDTVSITVSDVEDQTGMTVGVTITLDADHSFMTLTPFVQNNTATAHDYQYWLNAMIALGDNTTNDQTEFIVPASQVLVHSRDAGATYLPEAGQWMNWPEHDGRFFHIYGDWTHYLGFFAPTLSAGFSGVYDHAVQQGIVRVFDPEAMPGTKYFGPANLEPHLYTDGNTVYVEMWSSGVTPDFWTYVTLDPGETASWTEHWYPVRELGSFDMANEVGALRSKETGEGAEIGLQVTTVTSGTLSILVDGQPAAGWPGPFAPDQPFTTVWERPSGLSGPLSLQLLDEQSQVLIAAPP